MIDIQDYLSKNEYPGRGVLLGITGDGSHAALAYFIMGRSINSRNRIFTANDDQLLTKAYNPLLLTDPSLIIYSPIRVLQHWTIVTNGDQTDTIYNSLKQGRSFQAALRERSFEPDAPNYTPRISGLVEREPAGFRYQLAILKRGQNDADVRRYFYEYAHPAPGQGQLIHTYQKDGQPLPAFAGEPVTCAIPNNIDELTEYIWEGLNEQNRISLCVRYLNTDGSFQQRILNKNGGR